VLTAEAYHRALFDSIAAGVVVHDQDGWITCANAAACTLLGLSLDQLLGRAPIDPYW
jgi:PAS domain S-box-containing protein